MPLRKKKDKEATEFQKEMARTEELRPQSPDEAMMSQYINSLGRSVYTILDEEVIKLLAKHNLEFLVPLLSHLNRMTKIGKEDVVLDRLDIEYIFLRAKCMMKEDDYDEQKAALLETLEYFAMHIPTDSFEGFKAELLAYTFKVIRTELEEKKTKGLF